MRLRSTLCVGWTLLLLPSMVASQAHAPFALDARQESILLGGGSALGVTALLLGEQVVPLTSDEIARLDLNDVNHFDRAGVAPYREDLAGDALLAVSYAIPLALLAAAECRRDWRTLGVMWVETTLLNMGTAGVVKSAVQRTRPYAYDPQASDAPKTSKSARLSFYSGHTSQTAANCFFAARVFSSYANRCGAKALVWAGAVLYPAVTAFSRVDSGHHFRTDVLSGYCIGALIGSLVQELHRVRGFRGIAPEPLEGGLGLGLRHPFH